MAYRTIDAAAAREAMIAARRAGLTLARASASAGLHVATACRWQRSDPAFAAALRSAEAAAAVDRYAAAAPEAEPESDPFGGVRRRPRVEVHRDCPACGRPTEVRKGGGGIVFWRCSSWLGCGWASWRPRSPWACGPCGGPTLWSHRRVSVLCITCGDREVLECE
ncbi:MAG TPA: hypothetical protein VD866_07800 [Urbifossiella sp.]|nr:hypothetical protein [Urbifossiella sp.]